jgi:hypothetical protein
VGRLFAQRQVTTCAAIRPESKIARDRDGISFHNWHALLWDTGHIFSQERQTRGKPRRLVRRVPSSCDSRFGYRHLSVATHRNLDLAVTLPSELANVVRLCLRRKGYSVSQELAAIWISEEIDTVVFPSVTRAGRNVAVYLANALGGSVIVRNRAEVSWRPSADHASGSATGSGSFLTRRSRCQAFSNARRGTDLLCENQKVSAGENNPPSCPPTGVFLVLKLNFIAKVFAL